MDLLSSSAGWILIALGLYLIALSYARLCVNFRNRKDPQAGWSSAVPFIGPLLFVAGYALLPFAFSSWAFLAFALDPDTVIITLNIPVAMWCSFRDDSR